MVFLADYTSIEAFAYLSNVCIMKLRYITMGANLQCNYKLLYNYTDSLV